MCKDTSVRLNAMVCCVEIQVLGLTLSFVV